MKKIISLLILIFLISGMSVLAQNDGAVFLEEALSGLVGQELPGPIKHFVKNGDVNVYIFSEENEVNLNLKIINGVLSEINSGHSEKPTLDLKIDQKLLVDLQASNDSLVFLKQAKKDGLFSYKAYGFFNKIKFAILFKMFDTGALMADLEKVEGSELSGAIIHYTSQDIEEENVEETESIIEEDEIEEDGSEVDGIEGDNSLVDEPEVVEPQVIEPKLIEETSGNTHTVYLNHDGFDPEEITISLGDTIVWENVRFDKNPHQAMIIGTRISRDILSDVLIPGESFSWIFNEPNTHVLVGGIMTTKMMKVIVE